MNQIYITLPFIQFITALILTSVVILSAPRDPLNRLFALFLGAIAAWGITIFGMRDAFPDAGRAYAIEKVVLAVIPFSGILFYHFVHAFARLPRGRSLLYAFYGLGIASAVLSLLGWAATGMVEKFYGFAPELGWAFPLVLLASYPPVFLAMYDLTRAIPRAAGSREQSQLRLLRLGAVASVLGGTSDFIPSLGLNIYPMGVLGNIAFMVLATAAVTRYRLMNLRLVLRQGLAHTVISSSLFAVYGAAVGIVLILVRGQSLAAIALAVAGTVLVVGVFVQPILSRIQEFVDRLFFRERVDRLSAMVRLNSDVRDITDFYQVVNSLVEGVRRSIQSDWVAIILPDRSESKLVTVEDSRGAAGGFEMSRTGAVASWFDREQRPLFPREFATDPYLQAMAEEESELLAGLGARLLVPLRAKGDLSGILALGPKLVGNDYSPGDVSFLMAVADQSALAIQNARMFANEVERLSELERLGSLKSNLLQTVSHELKSPITAIKLSTEMLEVKAAAEAVDERRDRLIRTLKNGIDRLERLTQEALDYAAMQSAQLELQPVEVSLKGVVDEAIGILSPAIRARRQDLTVNSDPAIATTYADSRRVERILSNLISNACKYTPEGGKITIDIFPEDEYHVVRVADNGRGISKQDLELIFSPFYRSGRADGSPVAGTGLGLSIAQFLAELHGGKLSAVSEVGVGSQFSLYLPAAVPESLCADDEEQEEPGAELRKPWSETPGTPLPGIAHPSVEPALSPSSKR